MIFLFAVKSKRVCSILFVDCQERSGLGVFGLILMGFWVVEVKIGDF